MKKTIFAVLGLIWAPVSADAQQFSADDLTFRIVQRRAVEAVIWGIPAVNYDLMLQEMLKLGARPTRSSIGPACRIGRTRRSRPIQTRST